MNFEEYARMNERFMEMTPTEMVKVVDDTNFNGQEKIAFKLWAKTYPNNGAGESGLISRLAEFHNVEPYTIEALVDMQGGLSEAIYEFEQGEPNNSITLVDVAEVVYTDSRETSYVKYFELYPNLSSLGRKWLTAFMLKETRHGCGETAVKKMLAKLYGFKVNEIKKAAMFMPLEEVITKAIDTGNLEYVPIAGNYMKPMLAKGGDFSIRNRRWCDYKYDGIRAQVHQNEDGIKIFNRKGDDITSKFERDLIPIIKDNSDPVDWIVDGEIYPIDAAGSPAEFKNIMSRIHGKTEEVIYRNEVTIRLFDCIMYGGQSVFEDNLDTRLETLKMHFQKPLLAKSKEINNQDEMLEYYNESIKAGFEGVIVKDPAMSYDFGKRSKGWMKFKPPMIDIDCVITNAHMGAGKRQGVYGSYEISISDGEKLLPFGSVGSGFTDEDLIFLTRIYNQRGANQMIIEVKGDMITQNENGEYGLRFPRYVKYRDDKDNPTDKKELKI